MKNFFVFILVVLLLFSFSACKGNSQQADSELTINTNSDNSVEKIYNDFLSGKITAVYADGSDINIDYLTEMATPNTLTYALFDRNGDSVPELCINNEMYVTTFWVSNGTLKLWREENSYSKILSNGNSLETHYGGAPNHTDYSYTVYSYTGDVVCSVTFSVLIKNDVDVLENKYLQHTYISNGNIQGTAESVEISKEQFDKGLAEIENIGEANISWEHIK